MFKPRKPLPFAEFVILLSLMISILAMSTDVMLPGLDRIGQDLRVANPNNVQLVVLFLFVGFAVGQVIAGPISDSLGRKPVIYIGYVLFIVGCLLSMLAQNFAIMLLGRILQGIGASAPRVVTLAMVRDDYEGREMAQIMSFVMAVFILVPTLAPLIGQGIIIFFGWRATFAWLLLLALIAFVWFALRQPETLPTESRLELSTRNFASGLMEVCRIRITVGYSICAGFIFGAFIGYLGSSQQIYVGTYGTGLLFPVYFGATSLAIGAGSIVNSKLVMKLGMRLIVRRAFVGISIISLIFSPIVLLLDGVPPIWVFLVWHVATFFGMGLLFGNLNALAMEPLGKLAGLGAAVVGSLSTAISLPLGWLVGFFYDGGVFSVVFGFGILGVASLLIMDRVEKFRDL